MKLKFPWQKFQMIQACKELMEMRLWESYENLDFFVVETPLEEPVVVSIMGAGGEEYGISVFRGPDAFKQPIMITNEGKPAADKINTIGFSMVHYRDMQYEEKKWLKSCNYRAKKSEWLPSVVSKKPGEMMQMVEKDHDINLMLYIVKGIVKAQEDGKFCPAIKNSGSKIFTIEVSGDVSESDVKVTHKSFPGSKELLQRDDVDYDEDCDVYIWFKDNPDDLVMEATLLARIFFQDNKIKAETNSENRLDCLIDMLETIKGTRYLEHESKDVEEMLKEVPEKNKDIVKENLPEEFRAAVQDRMNQYYMDWLDKPNPALGNKTPRQAAKDKKSAQKTRILIETIPAPASSNDIKIPKKEMLRSIGFDEN